MPRFELQIDVRPGFVTSAHHRLSTVLQELIEALRGHGSARADTTRPRQA